MLSGAVSPGTAAAPHLMAVHVCAGAEGLYADDELDDEEYYPEDEVDPDNMTYEVRRTHAVQVQTEEYSWFQMV